MKPFCHARIASTLGVLVVGALAALAQESASYRLDEHAVNAGGVPAQGQIHTSASFRITLESIAGPVGHHAAAGPGSGVGVVGGFVPGHPPASEVHGLRFEDGDTLAWDPHPAAGTFQLYRDSLSAVGPAMGDCLQNGIAQANADDASLPAPGTGYAYLITVENTIGEAGTPGAASGGGERTLSTPCL